MSAGRTSTRPSATRWRCPLDSSRGKRLSRWLIPSVRGHLVDARRCGAWSVYLPVRPDFSGDARFSLTVFCGYSA